MKIFRSLFLLLMAFAVLAPVMAGGSGQQPTPGVPTINFMRGEAGPVPRDVARIERAINAITEREIGVRINLQIYDATYAQQIPLMIAAGEPMDIFYTLPGGAMHFTTFIAQNALLDLTDHIAQHGQDMVRAINDVLPDLLVGTTVNGRIYGIPGLFSKVINTYFCAREDLVRKHNIDLSRINNLNDVRNILEVIQRNETMPPIVPTQLYDVISFETGAFYDDFNNVIRYDMLGETNYPIGAIDLRNPSRVVNIYRTPEYRRMAETARDWYMRGLVYRDSAVNQERAEDLIRANNGFAFFTHTEIGVESAKSAMTGFTMVAPKVAAGMIDTAGVQKFVWVVAAHSRQPEASVKLLNQLYSDPRLTNLFIWGEEGTDYVGRPDGTIGFPPALLLQQLAIAVRNL